ncbi:MAG: HIT domain-containing protein [Candidatus Omnitrophica bacterium]|nr:HIT domain-containing protein [Candidatus Omnitrophota bacterium]
MKGQAQGKLWAPWRLRYIALAREKSASGCVFCRAKRTGNDDRNHVIARGIRTFSLLNKYPYNNGHVMVAPYRHIGDLAKISQEEWAELLQLTVDALNRLEASMSPHGYNIGLNIGKIAGAGIPGHLHLHVVPRWTGDTNFMPVVSDTKVISQSLHAAYQVLRRAGRMGRGHAKKRKGSSLPKAARAD